MGRLERPIRIMIADDHQLLREGVQAVLAQAKDMQLVATASCGEEALRLFKETIPDVTLMDLRMPGMDGIDAITAICNYASSARIIALSTYTGDALVRSARKAGARGYLLKSMLADQMLDCIRAVQSGLQCWPQQVSFCPTPDELSPREREVVRLVAKGASNKEIGNSLGLSVETVKSYMRTILPKLGANDRAHAVAISVQRGILNISDFP